MSPIAAYSILDLEPILPKIALPVERPIPTSTGLAPSLNVLDSLRICVAAFNAEAV